MSSFFVYSLFFISLALANFSFLTAQTPPTPATNEANNDKNAAETQKSVEDEKKNEEKKAISIKELSQKIEKIEKDFAEFYKKITTIEKTLETQAEELKKKENKKTLKVDEKTKNELLEIEKNFLPINEQLFELKKIKEKNQEKNKRAQEDISFEQDLDEVENEKQRGSLQQALMIVEKSELFEKIDKELIKAEKIKEILENLKKKYHLTEEKISVPFSKTKEKSIPKFVFEIDGGINFLAESEEKIKKKYNFEKIGSKVAMSFSLKFGIVFHHHYLTMFAISYDRLRDYNYNLDASGLNTKYQLSYKKLSFGADNVFFFWPFESKYNLALSVSNHFAIIFKRSNQIAVQKYINSEAAIIEEFQKYYMPQKKKIFAYFFKPETRFYIKLTPISNLYFGLGYNLLVKNSILFKYPSFSIGVDLHFNLYKDETKTKVKTEVEEKSY